MNPKKIENDRNIIPFLTVGTLIFKRYHIYAYSHFFLNFRSGKNQRDVFVHHPTPTLTGQTTNTAVNTTKRKFYTPQVCLILFSTVH